MPVVIWSWFALAKTAAVIFTIYMVPVMLLDNVLRPLVMSRGLATPMPVILIGVIGGALAHGLIGLFIGPIVLSIAWQLLVAWMREGTDGRTRPPPASKRSGSRESPALPPQFHLSWRRRTRRPISPQFA